MRRLTFHTASSSVGRLVAANAPTKAPAPMSSMLLKTAPTACNLLTARYFSRSSKENKWIHDKVDEDISMDDLVKSIDTTLTPEQQAYVNSLKKKMKGGKGERSLYRDVPRPEEVQGLGNFMPKMADNADALIDWALSHIPKKTGPRRSRHKKRVLARETQRRAHAAQRKQQEVLAKLHKDAKLKRVRQAVKAIREQGKSYRELLAASRHARQQQQAESSQQSLQTSE
eukprot:gene32954-39856_t